jgi:hypothetical protein
MIKFSHSSSQPALQFPASSRGERTFSNAPPPPRSHLPTPPPGGQGSMVYEDHPAQHHPSPHRGVEGSRRASSDRATLPQCCPPASPHRVVGWSSRQAVTLSNSPPSHTPSHTAPTWASVAKGGDRILEEAPLPSRQHLPTPSPSTNGVQPWVFTLVFLLSVTTNTRKLILSAGFLCHRQQVIPPPDPSPLDVASGGETTVKTAESFLPARSACKQSSLTVRRLHSCTAPHRHCQHRRHHPLKKTPRQRHRQRRKRENAAASWNY